MKYTLTFLLSGLLAWTSCQKTSFVPLPPEPPQEINPNIPFACNENCQEGVHAYYLGGRLYLWGGEDTSMHFDITGWSLELPQLKAYGYDRETFKALLHPEYQPVQEVAGLYPTHEPVIWLQTEEGLMIYPYILMRYHEVVNETAFGQPVMIAYCYLADLAAVYSRTFSGQTHTFAVSGYTYADPNIWRGRQGFVLWDRDTESLWWPLMSRGVSGAMQNAMLREHNPQQWGLSTWGQVLDGYPDALVMRQGQ